MNVSIYSTPDLRSVGRVSKVVLGGPIGHGEGIEPTDANNRVEAMEIGLDDPNDD